MTTSVLVVDFAVAARRELIRALGVVPIGLRAGPTRVSNTIGHMGQLRSLVIPTCTSLAVALSKVLQGNADEGRCDFSRTPVSG